MRFSCSVLTLLSGFDAALGAVLGNCSWVGFAGVEPALRLALRARILSRAAARLADASLLFSF